MTPCEAPAGRPLIAVFDDEAQIREVLCATLERAGFETVEARDSAEALGVLEARSPDAILMDTLEFGRGTQAIRILRSRSRARRVPILFLTGCMDEDLPDEAQRAGADGFRLKPFSPLRLVELIAALASGETR